MTPLAVRAAVVSDRSELNRLMRGLFPQLDAAELAAEIDEYLSAGETRGIFVAERASGELGGFVEVGTRSYAEGCESSPVPYIEAWFVDADLRRSGVGRSLFSAAENWARERGFTEIASDVQIGNDISLAAHAALGYEETERIVCFRRSLQ